MIESPCSLHGCFAPEVKRCFFEILQLFSV